MGNRHSDFENSDFMEFDDVMDSYFDGDGDDDTDDDWEQEEMQRDEDDGDYRPISEL